MRIRKAMFPVQYFLMVLIPVIVIPVLSEVVLALARYPIAPLIRASNPPNYKTTIQNIEFIHEFSTNRMGIRYPEIPISKPSREKRVLMLGDSYTEGLGVSFEKTFGALLEDKFSSANQSVRFINGGLTGTGPLEYAKLFYFVGLKYKPDTVLIILHTNDLSDTLVIPKEILRNPKAWREISGKSHPIKKIVHSLFPRLYTLLKMLKEKGGRNRPFNLIERTKKEARERGIAQENIDTWISKLPKDLLDAANRREFNPNILTASLIDPDRWTKNIDLEGEGVQEGWSAMLEILGSIVQISNEKRIPVGIIFTPSPLHYDAEYWAFQRELGMMIKSEWAERETVLERKLKRWAESQGLPFLNLAPNFRGLPLPERKKLYYPIDGHWTPKGHEFVSEIIKKWLTANKNIIAWTHESNNKELKTLELVQQGGRGI